MKIGKQAAAYGRMFDVYMIMEFFIGLILFIASWFSMSVVGFLRRNFGENYYGWINLFFAYTVVANFAFLFNLLIGVFTRGGVSQLMVLCWLGFIAVSVFHRWEIRKRNKAGIEWHSDYVGDSMLPLPFSQELTLKWVEPGLVLALSILLWKISFVVALWLLISALSLFLHTHILYFQEHQMFLRARDARIEARYLSDALAGKSAKATGGFVIAESDRKMLGGAGLDLEAIYDAMGVEMHNVMDTKPERLKDHGRVIEARP